MSRFANPYTPGAGCMPAYLAGRDDTLNTATQSLSAVCTGYPQQPVIYYGLCGVGKTVLLNAIEEKIEDYNIIFEHIEVAEKNGDFLTKISSACTKILHILSFSAKVKDSVASIQELLRAIQVSWNPKDQSFSAGLSGETSPATGNLSIDLTDLFVQLGKAAKKADQTICFFIDEVQYLSAQEAEALINALHRVNQLRCPITVYGAGLPKVLKAFGEAKSYSERLFQFIKIDSLDQESAIDAICMPARDFHVTYDDDAVNQIIETTKGYPYFIQELCNVSWDKTDSDVIRLSDVLAASDAFYQKLDQSFFKTRFDRCTRREQDFVFAMVRCGELPCTIANVAHEMSCSQKNVATYRAQLIDKGIIYATRYGEIDFTVPQFDDYLRRLAPDRTRTS